MIDLHYWPTPNGHKITMCLEEAGLEYQIRPVDISAGDQFKPAFCVLSSRPLGRRRCQALLTSPRSPWTKPK